jgi:predicted ATPase
MTVIKRIEIRNFRSIHHLIIDGGLKNLNVLVGNNDIGKSNILRALNLFFNNKTDIGKSIDFWEDFNKNIKRSSGKGQYIKIILDIDLKYEKNKYVRWTRQWNNQGVRNIDIKEVFLDDGTASSFIASSRAPGWLDRIIFRYIPAIKAPSYFQHLFEELHDLLNSTYSKQFQENTKSLIQSIQDITTEITTELSESLSLKNKISLPTDLKVFFGSLDFSLELNGRNFNLASRGDGIKVRHIPVVLRFLAQKVNINRKGALDIQTIWGFEEPENNLEMSHAFEVAKKFIEYSAEIQMFITTHSPAFYSLKDDKKNTSCWFVERNIEDSTMVTNIAEETIDIDEKMGILAYITPFVNEKNEEIKKEKEERFKLIDQINSLNPQTKCIVFTEDSADELQMIKAIIEANRFVIEETTFFSYEGKDNLKNAIYASKWLIKEKFKNVKHVIFHRDRDIDGDMIYKKLMDTLPSNYYLFITEGYDLDSYFLNEAHICNIYPELHQAFVKQKIDEAIRDTSEKSIKKLIDGLFQMYHDNKSLTKVHSPSRLEKEAQKLYDEDTLRYSYGKTVLGNLKGKLQHKTTSKNFMVFKPTEHLKLDILRKISGEIWNNNTDDE